MRSRRPLLAAALALVAVGAAEAHDPGLSRADVTLSAQGATAEITFARRDVESLVPIDRDGDGVASDVEITAARTELESLGRSLLEIGAAGPEGAVVQVDASDVLRFSLRFPVSMAREIHAPILDRLPRGHRQHVTVRGAGGATEARGLLAAGRARLDFAGVVAPGVEPGRFFVLGVEHILAGWDHLLFLLALLLAGGGVRRALGIVTSFTAAHSVTLALAAFGAVRIPAAIVEPLIAASIVWVAAENLLRRESRGRWPIAFGFGLVHGLGFASALSEAGIASQALGPAISALLAFNVGVETGQIALVSLALIVAHAIRRIPQLDLARAASIASAAVAACGVFWLVERTML